MENKDELTVDYWANRWEEGKTGWHKDEPNPHLVNNAHLFVPFNEKYRIFVPLCGKSLDILWLYKKGHEVVGVEGVDSVVQQFGEEHSLNFTVEDLGWATLYKTSDSKLKIYVCDFFSMKTQEIGRVDAVWDRGSLVAINPSLRPAYVDLMKKMVRPHFRYLVSVLDYIPNEKFSGPPCAVPVAKLHEYFGDIAHWELLYSEDVSAQMRFVNADMTKASEHIVLLTQKQ